MTELSNTELDNIDEVMNDIMEKKTFIEHSYSTYKEAEGRDKQDIANYDYNSVCKNAISAIDNSFNLLLSYFPSEVEDRIKGSSEDEMSNSLKLAILLNNEVNNFTPDGSTKRTFKQRADTILSSETFRKSAQAQGINPDIEGAAREELLKLINNGKPTTKIY
jgi:sugar-specific transcriptional regulator TrmB